MNFCKMMYHIPVMQKCLTFAFDFPEFFALRLKKSFPKIPENFILKINFLSYPKLLFLNSNLKIVKNKNKTKCQKGAKI